MVMNIRVAEINDIPQLCELLHDLFAQEIDFVPNEKLQIAGLTEIINNRGLGDIVIAIEDFRIVGMVNLLYTISTALGGPVLILEDMVVNSNIRGQGVGSELINFAFDLAKRKGFLRITLLTDDDNESAHKFYQKHGFNRSPMTVFRKYLL
jgi:GNAT superfamily N-acetyltransferase